MRIEQVDSQTLKSLDDDKIIVRVVEERITFDGGTDKEYLVLDCDGVPPSEISRMIEKLGDIKITHGVVTLSHRLALHTLMATFMVLTMVSIFMVMGRNVVTHSGQFIMACAALLIAYMGCAGVLHRRQQKIFQELTGRHHMVAMNNNLAWALAQMDVDYETLMRANNIPKGVMCRKIEARIESIHETYSKCYYDLSDFIRNGFKLVFESEDVENDIETFNLLVQSKGCQVISDRKSKAKKKMEQAVREMDQSLNQLP